MLVFQLKHFLAHCSSVQAVLCCKGSRTVTRERMVTSLDPESLTSNVAAPLSKTASYQSSSSSCHGSQSLCGLTMGSEKMGTWCWA